MGKSLQSKVLTGSLHQWKKQANRRQTEHDRKRRISGPISRKTGTFSNPDPPAVKLFGTRGAVHIDSLAVVGNHFDARKAGTRTP